MLTFEGNKIVFNTEVGINANYKLTEFPFANGELLKQFLPKCELYSKVKASEIKDSGQIFGMNAGKQFLSFISSWLVNVIENSDFYMTEEDFHFWVISYYKSLIDFHNKFGEHTADELFFPDFQTQPPTEDLFINLKKEKSPIIIDYPVKPEISWAVVDCWERLIRKEEYLPFEDQVNAYIKDNINRLKFWCNKVSYFKADHLAIPKISFAPKINIRTIDFNNVHSYLYFYCPICSEPIRTNYKYLREKWNQLLPDLVDYSNGEI